MKLSGKMVVVTGASRGIGRSLAAALARSGCQLLLTAVEGEELRAVADDIETRFGTAVMWRPADLADDAGRRSIVDWIRGRDFAIDILVNNAGAGRFGRFSGSAWEIIERTLSLNVHAPTFLMHEFLPLLKRRPEAMIVNISSAIGPLPYPGLAVYGAAKGYLSDLSASLQCELAGTGVRLLCFHPGFTATSFIRSAGMDLRRLPSFMIAKPDLVADRIVRAMRRNAAWAYADATGRVGVAVARALPHRVRTRLFRDLFWEVPPE